MVDFFAWHGYGGLLTGKNLNGDFGNSELRGDLLRAVQEATLLLSIPACCSRQ